MLALSTFNATLAAATSWSFTRPLYLVEKRVRLASLMVVHPLDLTVRPRVVGFGQAMFDVVCFADHVEAHLARPGGVTVAGLFGELDAPFGFAQDRIVGQDLVDAAGHGFQQVFEELPCCPPISLVDQLGDRELAGAVDADKQKEFAFGGLHLGDVDVEEADWIAPEALAFWLVAFDIWQAGDTMPLSQRCNADRVRFGIDGCKAYPAASAFDRRTARRSP